MLTRDLTEAIEIANRLAPEHLELTVADPFAWLSEVRHAGAIFLGAHTLEVVGDYLAGPNHVLSTGATARYASGLSVEDFVKRSSLIQILAPRAGGRLAAPGRVGGRGGAPGSRRSGPVAARPGGAGGHRLA